MKAPSIKEVTALVRAIKKTIDNDCRAYDEDDTPAILITIGADKDGNWGFQTGDNSFTGGAYGFPFWGIAAIYRNSNCHEIARSLIDQVKEAASY